MKKILLLLSFVCIRQIHGQIISTVAGNGTQAYSGDGGQAISGELYHPAAVALDAAGNLYIVDQDNQRVRKVSTTGIITTVAGNGNFGYSGDGGQATSAELNSPNGIAIDAFGNLYICDYSNHRIRKVNTSGIITTVAGNGVQGFSGDGGQATNAELNAPSDVVIDVMGNIYIDDYANYRIRKVNTSGIITTIAGNGTAGFSGDGAAAINAELGLPTGIAVDTAGNVYVCDEGNNRIRKINTSGIINTIVGNGTVGFSGDGGQALNAELHYATKITLDVSGNLYISDWGNNRIRVVNNLGIINTVVGNGTSGFSGDGGQANNAEIHAPEGLAFDSLGNLYISDLANNRVRMVNNITNGIRQLLANNNEQIIIYPNPTSDQFFIDVNTTDKLNVDLFDVNGRHVFSARVIDKSNISVATLDNGSYTMTIKAADRVINKKLVVIH